MTTAVLRSISSYDEIIEEKYKCQILKQCAVGLSANTPVSAFMPVSAPGGRRLEGGRGGGGGRVVRARPQGPSGRRLR